ncbi:MAG TPA: peptidyl-prolyl cis-trans isomerase, partial [Ignavibacteriaceae bacterium]|nr:peptidyl-prolyl cis-trans isomerase [Ignavibacteriaceae bacterium]
YKKYMANFFKDKKIRARGDLLKLFVEKVDDILEQKVKSRKSDTEKVFISNIDILQIEDEISSKDLSSIYVELNGRDVTLKDFISYFRFEPIGLSKIDYQSVLDFLNSKTRHFIQQELLADEGLREGVDKLPSVQYSYKMWRDNYYFYLLQNMFNDSTVVSDREVLDYYMAEGKKDSLGDEVRISEISVDSLETIETILDEIDKGTDFESLARRYSGEKENTEFEPAVSFGEIGRISESMQPGGIYGPVKTGEKYSVFKLIDRRRKKEQRSFESEKANIKETLARKKFQEKLAEFTTSLAMKYGFSINQEALSNIQVTSINSMVYQVLGFGGKIPAVPLSLPSIQWYNKWKEKHDIIQ